jgi:stage II sporulation protein D
VVPVEMPATWPAQALMAQAIVARSWTMRHLRSSTLYTYDVFDDTRSQVYRGVKGENAGVSALIAAQPGAVLYYGTSIVNAFYASAAGGWTENNEYAFVPASGVVSSAPLPYLRGRDDRGPGGTAYDAGAPGYAWQTALLTHAQLNAILGADPRTSVGTVTKLDLTHRGVSGRLYQVVIYGTAGTKTVSGDVFRAVFNAHRPAGTASMLSNLFNAAPIP